MATPMATKRLKQDYIRLQRDPVPFIEAAPLPSNLLEWSVYYKMVKEFDLFALLKLHTLTGTI